MPTYEVVNKTKMIRLRNEQLKADDGALQPGYRFDSNETFADKYAVVRYNLPGGENPPYAILLSDLKTDTPLPTSSVKPVLNIIELDDGTVWEARDFVQIA